MVPPSNRIIGTEMATGTIKSTPIAISNVDGVKADAVQLLQEEFAKYPDDEQDIGDAPVFRIGRPTSTTPPQDIATLLNGLYFRARCQSALLHLLCHLHTKGLACISNVARPINWLSESGPEQKLLGTVLQGFEYVRDITDYGTAPMRGLGTQNDQHWAFNIRHWVEIIIARGAGNIVDVVQAIIDSNMLGGFDRSVIDKLNNYRYNQARKYNPDLYFTEGIETEAPCWGWTLPSGVGDYSLNHDACVRAIADTMVHIDRIERVYKAFFEIADKVIPPCICELKILRRISMCLRLLRLQMIKHLARLIQSLQMSR